MYSPGSPCPTVLRRADIEAVIVNNEAWFFGISHGMAYPQQFRPQDQIRLTQSPSGGGMGNPAWDFQYWIPDYKLNERYQFVMRAKYVPFESRRQIRELARDALPQP